MAGNKPDLKGALGQAAGSARTKPAALKAASPAEEEPKATPRPPSRKDKGQIVFWAGLEVRDQLKGLAVKHRTTSSDLLAEALNDLFVKYGLPEIAETKRKG